MKYIYKCWPYESQIYRKKNFEIQLGWMLNHCNVIHVVNFYPMRFVIESFCFCNLIWEFLISKGDWEDT